MAEEDIDKKNEKYTIGPIDPNKIVRRQFPSGIVQEVYPIDNRFIPVSFMQSGFTPDPRTHTPIVRNMKVYPDDVLICAYVKAGTHWVWEITKMLLKGEAEYDPNPKEVAMLEFHSIDLFENMSRPRALNTHKPVQDIPQEFRKGVGKVVFVQRNPKDIAVSFYNHMSNTRKGSPGTWEDFLYLTNTYGGFSSDWYQYTLEFEEEFKTNKDIKWHNMYFEDIKKNPANAIKELSRYLEVPCSDRLTAEIAEKCSFSGMKNANENFKFDHVNNSKPNPEFENPGAMYRKGEVGDWKNWFTVAQSEEFDKVFQDKMKNSGFSYRFTSS